ncbi:MAG TPA: CoA pyrophosphatase [Ktedonobacterales bacterium]
MDQTRAVLLGDAALLIPFLRQRLATLHIPAVEEGTDAPVPLTASQAGARHAAVLLPLYAVAGHPHLLFTRRTTTLSSHAGQISFPGGRRDADDPSNVATALRETREELALDPACVEVLGELPAVFTVVSNNLVRPVVGWLPNGLPVLRPNPAEVAAVIEAPLSALADPAIFHDELWQRGGVARIVRFYDLGPNRIWGLTASILHTLLSLIAHDE